MYLFSYECLKIQTSILNFWLKIDTSSKSVDFYWNFYHFFTFQYIRIIWFFCYFFWQQFVESIGQASIWHNFWSKNFIGLVSFLYCYSTCFSILIGQYLQEGPNLWAWLGISYPYSQDTRNCCDLFYRRNGTLFKVWTKGFYITFA